MDKEFARVEMTEKVALKVYEALEDRGYEYDVDFTTLYGAGWAIIGLIFYGKKPLMDALPMVPDPMDDPADDDEDWYDEEGVNELV